MYSLDKDFFKTIDTEEKAYWLGFIYADGCITRTGVSYTLRIKLSTKDVDHLEKFKRAIKSNAPIRLDDNERWGNIYHSATFIVCNLEMCKDLMKLGCGERKSLTLLPPTLEMVPKEFINHFIRGYLDGDGWVSTFHNNRKYKLADGTVKICRIKNIDVGFCGTVPFLLWIQDWFIDNLGFKKVKMRSKCAISEIRWQRPTKGKAIYHLLYDNATVFMYRKKEKFDFILAP